MPNKYSESKYRWYAISLSAITMTFCVASPNICMSVLFDEISNDLNLDLVQVGWIWGSHMMAGLFTVFIAGLLADRLGAKRVLFFACLFAGLTGASRGLANDFNSLLFATILAGLFMGVFPSNMYKVAATWFPPYQLGLATGILTTGMGIGFTASSMFSATQLSPMLGGWRYVLFLYGAISVFIALLWLTTYKEKQSGETSGTGHTVTTRESITHLIHNKNVWLISLAMVGYVGCIQGVIGYLPLYLRDFQEWRPTSADGALAAFTGFSTACAIPISLLSDKLGRRKSLILLIITITAIGVGLLSVADGIMIWGIIIIIGIGRDGLVALVSTSTVESEGIGAKYSGSAIGFMQTIARISVLISPPIGNSMAKIGAGIPFLVWAAFGIFALVCFSMTKETGTLPALIPKAHPAS